MMATEFPDRLLTRGFNQERDRATANLRRSLTEVQRLTAALVAGLDTAPSTAPLAGDARALVHYAGEAASFAAAVEMAHQLAFLLPVPTDTEES